MSAHPMGNFSVSHYAKLQMTQRGVELVYALDLAEIPTSALLSEWNLGRSAPAPELDARAAAQAREWLKNLIIKVDGKPLRPHFESAKLVIADGAGNLPILRITTHAHLDSHGGNLTYEDLNFPDRTGWKEIVVDQGTGATLRQASQTSTDISQGLTRYPADPTIAPPQDLRARIDWETKAATAAPVIQKITQPKTAIAAAAPATMTAAAAPPGAVVKGDFLSRLLHQRELTLWMILVALGAAFMLGAAHALTPGHGKAIVAAYLVGSRGTLKHAAFLGAMVTFTHTITVFALGLATLFLYRYIVPEKITEVLGAISGITIVAMGGWMLYSRVKGRGHSHPHTHSHPHAHTHTHGGRTHTHTHSHVPDEISWKGLTALGASGGLVPCESALVLLLGAIALGRVGLGLLLLLSFSIGLALVLIIIGVLVLYAKNLLPAGSRAGSHPLLRWAAIASPAIVILVGLVMTGVSLGWIQSKWMIG